MANKKEKKVKEVKEEKNEKTVKDTPIQENNKEEKSEKSKRFLGEFFSFIAIALIIAGVAFGCWYWYTKVYNPNKNEDNSKETSKEEKYKFISYEADKNNTLEVLNNKYLIEKESSDSFLKILDMTGKEILNNENGYYTSCVIGNDGNLYVLRESFEPGYNSVAIDLIKDGKEEEVKTLVYGNYHRSIVYNDTIIGFVGDISTYDEVDYQSKIHIYLLNGQEYEVPDFTLINQFDNDNTSSYITLNERYLPGKNNETGKYGLLDLQTGKIVIEPTYDGLYQTYNGNFVAIKDGKAGIIDNKLKKQLEFDYDFIESHEDFYVVSKNNKLALLDKNYKQITDYKFNFTGNTYNYEEKNNSFNIYKVKDKYILVVFNNESENNELYIISKTGEYKTLQITSLNITNNLIWTYNNKDKKYTFYNDDLEEKYKLDFSSYDLSSNYNELSFSLVNNTLVTNTKSPIYFDYEHGEEIDGLQDYETRINNIIFKFNKDTKEVKVLVDDKEIGTYKSENNIDYTELENGNIYYLDKNLYILIEKDE